MSFPVDMLDLMAMCWSPEPNNRPSADEIVAIASSPHFSHLQQAVKSDSTIEYVTCSCLVEKSTHIDMTASVLGKYMYVCYISAR